MVSLFLEVTVSSVPLVLLSILLFAILYKESWIFPAAFLMGILLDILLFQTVGIRSIFFVVILGAVFLYQRKFEIQSLPFVGIATFLIAALYGSIFGLGYPVLIAVVSSIFAGIIFFGVSVFSGNTTLKKSQWSR